MKKVGMFFILLTALLMMNTNLLAKSDGEDILQKSDNILFPQQAKFVFRMEDYENEVFKRYYLLQGYLKGNNRYLIIGMEPALVKGIAQMRIDDAIFTYFKKVDVLQQISAKTAFYSSVCNQEDVMGGKLENFYNFADYATGTENNEDVYVLTLTAKSKAVAYQKIISYLDQQTLFPFRREYFAFSGQKVKEMVFNDIQLKDGRMALLKFTMYDSLRKGFFTKVMLSDFDYSSKIPDTYFTRMYLKLATK